MFKMLKISAASALLLIAANAPLQGATVVPSTLVGDAYLNPNSSSATGETIPLFAYYKDETSTFFFNSHYASMIMKWQLDVPEELEGQSYFITSARIVLWQAANRENWDPDAGQIKLFATGITGENGFTTETWTETQPYIGPSVASPTPLQDPYMIELGTNNRAENNLSATPWAIGAVDPAYDGSVSPAESFPITFTLNLSNPLIKDKIRADLEAGVSMWTAGSTFLAGQPGGPAAKYPRIVSKEGADKPAHGTLQQAPTLIIELSTTSAARNWELY